jgi:hypothetical protein
MGRGEGEGPLSVATEKNVKIAEVHSITSYFGHEDMVKTKLCIKVHEKSKNKIPFTIENFKISQLEEEQKLPEVYLNHKIKLHKTHHNWLNFNVIYIF